MNNSSTSRPTGRMDTFIGKHSNKNRPLHANVRPVSNFHRCISALGAFLAVAYLSACGSGSSTHKTATQSAVVQPAQTTATVQPTVAQQAAERIAVVHIGGNSITKATVDRLMSAKKPKIASYEPRSREACSSVRAPAEVKLAASQSRLTAAQIKRLCEQQHEQVLKEQVLGPLIASEWAIREAAQDGVPATDSQAERQLEEDKHKQFSSEAAFQRYLKNSGETAADLLMRIKAELASEKIHQMIKNKVGNVTQARIADYYNRHKQSYAVPEQRDIEAIRTWTKPAIDKAAKEVRSGVSFADVARRVSIDRPSNEHGGVTLGVVSGQEEKGYDEAIFAAKPHVLTGPLHLRKRYYIFEVNRIIPGRQKPFAEIESSIAQQLPAELQQQALGRFIKAWRKKWIAKTDCSPGYVVRKCRQFKVTPATPGEDPYSLN